LRFVRRGLVVICALVVACSAPLASARVLQGPGDITAEATGPSGAIVTYDAGLLLCNPASGSLFPLGDTPVTCLPDGSFTVHVVDTTPPVVTPPANESVTTGNPAGRTVPYGSASATDAVAVSPPVSCEPASGSHFPVGTTTVTCTATDGPNTGTATFTVTVNRVDNAPPSLFVPGDITAEATGPSGANVPFSVSASDDLDPSPTVSCDPTSGSAFPLGTTPVSCRASDASGNTSDPQSFQVIVQDTTPPSFSSVPSGTVPVEATSSAGASYSFTVAATDLVDSEPTIECSKNPAAATYPFGTTPVSCTATDDAGKSATAGFAVSVADTTSPTITVPADITAEATGPAGSKVNFPTPVAVDLVDGPLAAVSCSPASGSTFALGTATVTCSAADSRSNSGSANFNVTVADTTPPTLVIPDSFGIHATSAEGIPRTHPTISGVLGSASASDIVDPSPVVTNNAPAVLPIGTTDVTITARDATGNGTSKAFSIVVLPQPPAGTPPLPVPPAPKLPDNPKSLNVTPGDGTIKLAWAAVPGARQYLVYRSEQGTRRLTAVVHGQLVYSGTARTFTDRGLKNGVEYRYVVVVEDAAGNQSVGIAIVVVPRRDLLRSPKNGARLRKAPRLVWTADAEADYYNAQLVFGRVKVLSVWPIRAQFQLKTSWKFQGRKYTLKPGLYTWYVWPGYGAREAVDYGQLMGSRTFRITKKTK
jgi:hypothetical protein